MTLFLPIMFAAALCGWAFLSILGGERQRRISLAEIERAEQERREALIAAAMHGVQMAKSTVEAKRPAPKPAAPPSSQAPAAKKPAH